MLSAPVVAQTATQQADAAIDVPAIEVTGSRIRSANIVADAPVTTISAEEFKVKGAVNVEDLLNDFPQIVAEQTKGVSNGSTGTATIDLRGFGSSRTLVLIDGKRLGPGDYSSPAADVNFIPTTLIDKVEVLTGGASTDYGSDALAGVVNFKLKRDFEGVEIDQTFGGAEHSNGNGPAQAALAGGLNQDGTPIPVPGTQFDAFSRQSTILLGSNFEGNKGNVTAYFTNAHLDPVLQSSRDFSQCTMYEGPDFGAGNYPVCAGSSNSAGGKFFSNVPTVAGGGNGIDVPVINGVFVPDTGPHYTTAPGGWVEGSALPYNFGPLNYFQRQDDRYTAGAFAHYKVSSYFEPYADFGFMDDQTQAQIAPSGLFQGGGTTGNVTINCANPLANASQLTALGCNSTTVNANGQLFQQGGLVSVLTPGLRFVGNPRQDDIRHDDYRIVVGTRGDVYGDWTYDVSLTYWKSLVNENYQNDISTTKADRALNVVNVNGVPTCQSVVDGSDPSCVPLNIFQPGGVSKAAVAYLSTPAFKETSETELVASGNLSGTLGQWGGVSPWATNPVAVVVGYEYRFENLTEAFDNEFITGDLFGQGGHSIPVNGSYDDKDVYAEVTVPVVENTDFAKSISLDAGFRYSSFQVYGGSTAYDTDTYKLEGNWQVNSDVKFRGGYSRAARAPNANELFAPPAVGLTGGFNDTCAGPTPASSKAQCALTGLNPALYGTVSPCPAQQCSEQFYGNLNLTPEKADTWTAGFVFTPSVLPHFVASIDYWDVRINNYIQDTGIPVGVTYGNCLNGVAASCAMVHRGPGGVLFGAQGYVQAQTLNGGYADENGVDVSLGYTRNLADLGLDGYGSLKFSLIGTYTAEFLTATSNGATAYDCAGLYGPTCGTPGPKWRHTARMSWMTPWLDSDFTVSWRHISHVELDANTNQSILTNAYCGLPTSCGDVTNNQIGSYDYIDLALSVPVTDNVTFTTSVNNVFDKDPPIVTLDVLPAVYGNGNTFPGTYDYLGRTIYFEVAAKF